MLGITIGVLFALWIIGGWIAVLSFASLAVWNRRPEVDPGFNPFNLLVTESAFTESGRLYRRRMLYAIAAWFGVPIAALAVLACMSTWG
jgi:hypothetical protein